MELRYRHRFETIEMALTILLVLVLAGFSQGNRFLVESEEKSNDQEAFESFPITTAVENSGNPKSDYAVPTVPAGYLTGLSLTPYSRYGPSPYYNYGGPYNALQYGYAPGWNSDFSFGNPGLNRNAYTFLGNGFPGNAGLSYRFGGLGYNAAYFRAPGVPASLAPQYGKILAPLPTAGFTNGAVPYPNIPVAPVPPPAMTGRPPVITTQRNDGSLRYSPFNQRLPGY